ncbi:hypothetical protein NDU88_008741 [Pleurodeles waltl]|uniref:Uncharacterized protein n=1 Tax=Pleurodeles waltl TaxID=8319 RepID=A0AAV7QPG3_PLEWA|nr:hypothetical protein NDU88_008741 [Pleurodeles waltl]
MYISHCSHKCGLQAFFRGAQVHASVDEKVSGEVTEVKRGRCRMAVCWRVLPVIIQEETHEVPDPEGTHLYQRQGRGKELVLMPRHLGSCKNTVELESGEVKLERSAQHSLHLHP